MDKYEYNLKLDQMKSLCAEERYEEAAELADTINWNKVKNVNALVKVGEVFEKAERYQESRDVLLMAYDRSPIGRMIIYRLAEVAVKMKDYEGAQEYYDEFVKIAPHDNLKYVLRYDMKKGQGATYQELIQILEEFKEQEYIEEWAYELAYLYHKAERGDKCVDACDELILWFGDGPYVERALELKMLYQPLTKQQENKYRRFRQEKDGFLHISSVEMERGGEIAREDVMIPPVEINTGKFNTVNLQAEIVKGMQQIMSATEKATVSDTMVNIKKIAEEIPYLQIPKETSGMEELSGEHAHIETDEEIDAALKSNFQEMLEEESDGQISMVTSDKMALERQITGQLTIQDVLDEWERTRRLAEAALYDAEQRKLESEKARALQEAEDLMDRLKTVIPKLDAGVTPKELLEEEYMSRTDEGVTYSVEETPAEQQVEPVPQELLVGKEAASEEDLSELQEQAYVAPVNEITAGELPIEGLPLEELPIEELPVETADAEAITPIIPAITFPKIEPIRLQKAPQVLSPEMDAELKKTMEQSQIEPEPELVEGDEKTSVELIDEFAGDSLESDNFNALGDIKESNDITDLNDIAVQITDATVQMHDSTEEMNPESLAFTESVATAEEAIPEPVVPAPEVKIPQPVISEPVVPAPEVKIPQPVIPEPVVPVPEVKIPQPVISEPVVPAPEMKIPQPVIPAPEIPKMEIEKPQLGSTRRMPSWKDIEKERFMRQKTSSIPEIPLPEDLDLFEDDPDKTVFEGLTEKQKSIFSYFVPVKGMENQLCKALTGMSNHLRRREAATCGNLIIQGEQGCGKTVLATSVLKVLQEETGFLTGKVGKIDAASLNQKDLKDVVDKVKGGCLIIEKAGDLNQATVYELALLMEKDVNNTVYILEDTSKGIRKVLAREQIFTEKFTETISVPIFTNEELVVFARSYSNELGYKIDDMAELALHNRISNIQRLDQATTLTEVKEIIDEAIDKEAHGGLKKAISILTAKRYTEDDKIVLTERTFE